ncbi:MAG TPA: hypothetical protein VFZ33_13000 [Chitinophagaceae bacterium]
MKLETTNPNCFTYQTEESTTADRLLIGLLGGVGVNGLDRMRVTMKLTVINRKHASYLSDPELAGLSVRHNHDLYNDTQVEKFVRRVAEKLQTGSIALTKVMAVLSLHLPNRILPSTDLNFTPLLVVSNDFSTEGNHFCIYSDTQFNR